MTTPQPNAKTNQPLPDGRGSDSPFPLPHSAFRIHSPSRTQNSKFAFTLIEMLVVITIIAILMAAIVAVGTSVRANANRRSTVAELKLLSGVMQDYLAAGNPEPQVPLVPASPNGWYYGNLTPPGYSGNEAYNQTTPRSDPYNWVIAFQSDPRFAKKIAGLPTMMDTSIPSLVTPPTPHVLILDSFGVAIRYVPSSSLIATAGVNAKGYFMSAGPDGKFSNALSNSASPTPLHTGTSTIPADEIYSYDAQ